MKNFVHFYYIILNNCFFFFISENYEGINNYTIIFFHTRGMIDKTQ